VSDRHHRAGAPADAAAAPFRPTGLDLVLAAGVAIGLPVAAARLLDRTGGAAAGLALYYGVCCLALVRWRRGRLGYRWPGRWPWAAFLAALAVPLASAAANRGTLPDIDGAPLGVALTLLLWAPANAALEQLSWFYVFDAWRLRWPAGGRRWAGLAVGTLLMLVLVGLIHGLFWARVLPVADERAGPPVGIALNALLLAAYVALWLRSRSLWPVFFVHLAADAQLVLIARYSILPHL
jgi:hypothetical protein